MFAQWQEEAESVALRRISKSDVQISDQPVGTASVPEEKSPPEATQTPPQELTSTGKQLLMDFFELLEGDTQVRKQNIQAFVKTSIRFHKHEISVAQYYAILNQTFPVSAISLVVPAVVKELEAKDASLACELREMHMRATKKELKRPS